VATVEDYAVVRELVADLVSEGIEATVPSTVRETVEAVKRLREDSNDKPVSVTEIAKELKLDRSAVSRRVRNAKDRGYLRDLEENRRKPSRLVLGDELPDDLEILPKPEEVRAGMQERASLDARLDGPQEPHGKGQNSANAYKACNRARVQEGINNPPSPLRGRTGRNRQPQERHNRRSARPVRQRRLGGGMKARTALLELFKESSEWRAFFRSCCEYSAFRLRAQSWQFRDELKDRGDQFQADEVEDALLGLARELLPDTPAARWDAEWAHKLCKEALARLAERYAKLSTAEKEAVDLSRQDVWDEWMHAAGLANDPVAFRAALKRWEQAGLEATEQVRIKGGAA
jgi:biotin operon repressor